MAGIASLSVIADSVPSNQLEELQGKRMAAYGFTVMMSNLAASQILLWIPFPINYQILFFLGFLTSMLGLSQLAKVRVPDYAPMPELKGTIFHVLIRTVKVAPFWHFIASAFTFHLALGMLATLVPIFYIWNQGASDFQISLIAIAGSATVMIGSLLFRYLAKRFKQGLLLAIGVGGHALYPLLYTLAPSIWWIIPIAVFANIFGAAIGVSLFAGLVKITPEGDRTEFIGVYIMSINIAVFIGSLFAGFLAQNNSAIIPCMWLAFAINLTAAGMFWLWFVPRRTGSSPQRAVH
jgi:MFS family permease